MERTVILYHGGCPDGFGGAFAAWKKFGDAAEYVGLSRSEEAPVEEYRGAHLYFIDFCYDQATMDRFVAAAASVTVLDHHEGVEEVIKGMPEFVYDTARSGATIAWAYFHPVSEGPIPPLLQYVEDDDLFRFALPDTRPLMCYLETQPFTFELWDELNENLSDPTLRENLLVVARIYRDYFEKLASFSVEHAKLVEFEGHQVYFATTHNLKTMRSLVGNLLARKHGPFALVVSAHPEGYGVSIRSDGSVDVTKIAQKYGGNGHPAAAGFAISANAPMPWKLIEEIQENENPRD